MEPLTALSLPVPAMRGFFGADLITFQTQIRPEQIVQVLGHDPRSHAWKFLPPDLRELVASFRSRRSVSQWAEGEGNSVIGERG